MFFIKIVQEEGAKVAGDSVAGMSSDDGGTSGERGPSLAGITLDGELEGWADSKTAGSAKEVAVLTKACYVVLAESVAGVLEVRITACSAVSAESVAGILEVLAESQAAGCSAELAESRSDSAYSSREASSDSSSSDSSPSE